MRVNNSNGGNMDSEMGVEMPAEYQRFPSDVDLLAQCCARQGMDLKDLSRLPFKERIKIAREVGMGRVRLAAAIKWFYGWRAAYISALMSQTEFIVDEENYTVEFRPRTPK
jgi:hypothetical protein